MQGKHLIRFFAAFLLWTCVTCQVIYHWNARTRTDAITRRVLGVSLWQCMEECARIRDCTSVSYKRVEHKCRLGDDKDAIDRADCGSCLRNVVVFREDFPVEITSMKIVPVFEMETIPGCTFDHNVGGASLALICAGTDKIAIYTKQPNGEISNRLVVFQSYSGNGYDPYRSWMFSSNSRRWEACVYMKTCHRNYRHAYLDQWDSLAITQVRVSLKTNNQEVAFVLFDGENSDLENWFNQTRLVNSSWPDITPRSTFNVFSLKGEVNVVRRFFMSAFYKTCETDEFYMSAAFRRDLNGKGCDWENHAKPLFMFSNNTGPGLASAINHADTLEVVLIF